MTPEQLAKQIAADIAASVNESLKEIRAALEKRVAEVETAMQNRLAALPHPEKGDKGDPGEVDMEAVKQILLDAVAAIKLPEPEKGDKGDPGEVDMDAVQKLVAAEVAKVELPPAEKVNMEAVGEMIDQKVSKLALPKGDKGDPGEVDMEAVQALIAEQVAKIELPTPEKGDKGDPGEVDIKVVKELVAAAVAKVELPAPLSPLDIEIEAGIDEKKSYPRGVYATHRGGIWRSFEKTKGMRGWECIIAGVAEIEADYDGERTLTLKIEKSDGEVVTKEMRIPVPINKGMWRETGRYEKEDIVSFSGAMWVAQKDQPVGRPGASPDWQVHVKRGGTGKSAYDLARDAGFAGTRQEWLDSLGKKPTVKLPT